VETEDNMGRKKPQMNFKVRYTLAEKLKWLRKKGVVAIPIITIILIIFFVQVFFTKQKAPVDTRSRAENVITSPQRFVNLFQQGSDINLTAKRNNFFILNEWNSSRIAQIKAANPGAKVLLYKNSAYMRVSDNQSSVGGFQYVWDNHQDWFVKDTSGNNVYIDYYNNGDKWYYMDWGNPDWQKYWADKAIASMKANSWDGIFADDIYVSISSKLKDQPLTTYKTSQDVQNANRSFLAYQTGRIHAEGSYLATYNVSSELMWYPSLWADWLTISDGMMEEHFMHAGTDPNTGFTSIEDSGSTGNWWLRRVQMVTDSEKSNKNSMFVCLTGDNPPLPGTANYNVMAYCYVSYMLGANGNTTFITYGSEGYKTPIWFSLWEKDLGTPIGAYQSTTDNVFFRNFQKGKVVINPSKTYTRTFVLGDGYVDELGSLYPSTVTLTPHKAIVALAPINTPIPTAIPTPAITTTTSAPTGIPTLTPISTAVPTQAPTAMPTPTPTPKPTIVPTAIPTAIPTPVPTINPTVSLKYEAESAAMYGSLFANNHLGYTGIGFADYVNRTEDYLLWTINAPVSGSYKLNFRYANATSNRPLQIKVNSTVVSSSLGFPTTKSWDVWGYSSINVRLNAGVNTIKATATSKSGPNVDHLLITN